MSKIIISILFVCSFLFADFIEDATKAYNTNEFAKATKLFEKPVIRDIDNDKKTK